MNKILLIGLFLVAPAMAAERILDFHSDLRIAANGDLAVTERITIEARGGVFRAGLQRDLAPAYTAGGIEVKRVTRNGQPEPFALERLAKGVRVRTGRADAPLPEGRHVYEIAYASARQVGFFERHDELRWDVTGHNWPLALERASAEVQLPVRTPARELKPAARTGVWDARGGDYVSLVRDGGAAFRSTRALRPGEGLSIVVTFPKGVVAAPSAGQRAGWFLADNAWELAIGSALLALAGLLLALWPHRQPKA